MKLTGTQPTVFGGIVSGLGVGGVSVSVGSPRSVVPLIVQFCDPKFVTESGTVNARPRSTPPRTIDCGVKNSAQPVGSPPSPATGMTSVLWKKSSEVIASCAELGPFAAGAKRTEIESELAGAT